MEVEEAKKALEERKAKLADLREQNASLTQDIEGLQKERTAAVRAFAAGDKTKRKIIHDLDRKIEPLGFRLEGMKGLIKDAEAEVENATAGLRKAADEEKVALDAFIAAQQAEELQALIAGIPHRLQRIADLYMKLAKELGQLQIDGSRFPKCPGINKLMELRLNFNFQLNKLIEKETTVRRFSPSLLWLTVEGCSAPVGPWPEQRIIEFENLIGEVRRLEVERLTDKFYTTKNRC